MYDNGLLKYFKDYSDGQGRLLWNKVPGLVEGKSEDWDIFAYFLNKQKYFLRFSPKPETDAETLLSQLYTKLGLKSAIYVPAMAKANLEYVVSNNIEGENIVIAQDERLNGLRSKLLLGKTEALEGFSKPCIKQLALMQALDVATHNTDRNGSNWFLRLQDGKAVEAIVIDHECSARSKTFDSTFYNFFNDFSIEESEKILRTIKTNEVVLSATTPQEIGEVVGSATDEVQKIVDDVKETLGYKIDQEFADRIMQSCDKVAEDLVQ